MIENQAVAAKTAPNDTKPPHGSKTAADELPFLLSKGWLCARLGYSGAGRYATLRRCVLTDDVCQRAGFEWLDYHRRSLFTREHTVKLFEILSIH